MSSLFWAIRWHFFMDGRSKRGKGGGLEYICTLELGTDNRESERHWHSTTKNNQQPATDTLDKQNKHTSTNKGKTKMPKLVYFDDNSQKLSRSGTVSTKISSIITLFFLFWQKIIAIFLLLVTKLKPTRTERQRHNISLIDNAT